MKKPSTRLLVALTLLMLLPTWRPAFVEAAVPTHRDSLTTRMLLVSENTIRRATAVIDSLELRLMLAQNRLVEADSVRADHDRWWNKQVNEAWAWGDHWKQEATSWWRQSKSAIWLTVGAILAIIGLR